MSYHQQRVDQEVGRAKINIFLIDFLLTAYFFYAIYILAVRGFGLLEEASYWMVGLSVLGLSLIGSFYWAATKNSISRIVIYRTNKVLKGVKELRQDFHWKSASGIFTAFLIALTFIDGCLLTDMSFYTLFSVEGMRGARRIFVALFQPNLSIIKMVLESMVETIFIAFMATFLAIPVAFVGSFFCARNLTRDSQVGMTLYSVLRVIANFTRSVEPLVWAIIFSVWVGIGPFAGMLALMLHSVASLIKLYSEQIESINRGPMEAIEATGANRIQVVWYAVVPQIVLPYLSFTIYRWDINIRMATVIGLVGGGGVGTLLMQYQGLAQWNEVGTIVIVIAIVVWIMDYVSAKIREAIY